MDISIQRINDIPFDRTSRYYAYTIHVDHHRILTLATTSAKTLSKWLTGILKSTISPILIAVSAEHDLHQHTKRRGAAAAKDLPYDILTLCSGSQCLIYHLDTRMYDSDSRDYAPNKTLRDFFESPKVIALGMDMDVVANKMERYHGIKIKNALDIRALASEGFKLESYDVARYNVEKLAISALGKEFDMARPKKRVEWYGGDELKNYFPYWSRELRLEKVQFATVDAYLCFLVGSQAYQLIHHSSIATTEEDSKAKKKKEKKNSKN
ncbi:hypothetical protein RIF29_13511 [Crotalaria pallida]|uniref:Uncharacterized protein n=1 Tax=Crotalaria pallida TaxID=3830 RepID=A0AAN9IPB3_CROPI